MTDQHPITPPPELVQQWDREWRDQQNASVIGWSANLLAYVAAQAAQWGADQELEGRAISDYALAEQTADALRNALIAAECALADIAEGAPNSDEGDPLEWAERRCDFALGLIRPVMRQHKIRTSEWPPAAVEIAGDLPVTIRAARRSKPPSFKEQSLALIDLIQGNKKAWDIRDLDVVRRALERLPE